MSTEVFNSLSDGDRVSTDDLAERRRARTTVAAAQRQFEIDAAYEELAERRARRAALIDAWDAASDPLDQIGVAAQVALYDAEFGESLMSELLDAEVSADRGDFEAAA